MDLNNTGPSIKVAKLLLKVVKAIIIIKHLFLERLEQPFKSPKNPGNALSDALLMSHLQNFAAGAAKKTRSLRFFDQRTVLCAVSIST